MYVDAHTHLYEDPSMREQDVLIMAVSDDYPSSLKTLNLNVIPCVGIHPWEVEKSYNQLKEVEKLVPQACCIGEVGLDYRFVKDKELQKRVFLEFVRMAKEYDKPLNLHALDAWRDVFDILIKYDVKRAYFHWYNGPLNLLEDITAAGYFIGINAAIKIQKKHLRILDAAPLSSILTETDAPYNYHGLRLHPRMVKELVEIVAKRKNVDVQTVKEVILSNLKRLLGNDFENCIKRFATP